MSYGIGAIVEVIGVVYLGRWIEPLERGIVTDSYLSPAGQQVYDVRLDKDGEEYTFAPGEIEELEAGRNRDMERKEEVTLIEVTVAVRGKWGKSSVDNLVADFRTECLSKRGFISIWSSKIETKEMEILQNSVPKKLDGATLHRLITYWVRTANLEDFQADYLRRLDEAAENISQRFEAECQERMKQGKCEILATLLRR
ncbi:unnamed protein product [marine sediment metagenome]|uniref:Uncharacterized protein n=1 Tax=marine sediment metagenome TaxID=412755 RepID=X1UW20_9ZZZZ